MEVFAMHAHVVSESRLVAVTNDGSGLTIDRGGDLTVAQSIDQAINTAKAYIGELLMKALRPEQVWSLTIRVGTITVSYGSMPPIVVIPAASGRCRRPIAWRGSGTTTRRATARAGRSTTPSGSCAPRRVRAGPLPDTGCVQESERLLIDHAAAAERPSAAAVAEWAGDQRGFVSRVIVGNESFRAAAADAVEELGAEPVLFERFGGRDGDPNAAYLNEVRSCDIYIGLLGEKYGTLLPSRFSATHEEYREAERSGLRLSVWAQGGVDREGHQHSFLDEVRQFNVTGHYTTPTNLKAGLTSRLRAIAAEDLSRGSSSAT